MSVEIKVVAGPIEVVREAADRIVEAAAATLGQGQLFSMFLSGGSTPRALYELLASDAYRSQIDWKSVELYFGDERCVPPTSELSNYKTAHEMLIRHVPVPEAQVFRMKGEGDPQQAAKDYGLLLRERFLDEGPDLLLLGMGDDGHTASLFPFSEALKEQQHRCVAAHVTYDSIPAGTNWRLTLTYPFINRSRRILVLLTGVSKAGRLQEVLEGPDEPERLPIQGVAPAAGAMTWIIDVAAAGMASGQT